MAQRRRNRELRNSYLNINEDKDAWKEGAEGLTIDFFNNEFIKESNQICSLVLKILDIQEARKEIKKIIDNYYSERIDDAKEQMYGDDNKGEEKEIKHKKKITITPEQKNRIFYDGEINNKEGNEKN